MIVSWSVYELFSPPLYIYIYIYIYYERERERETERQREREIFHYGMKYFGFINPKRHPYSLRILFGKKTNEILEKDSYFFLRDIHILSKKKKKDIYETDFIAAHYQLTFFPTLHLCFLLTYQRIEIFVFIYKLLQ